jgi:hypothetical protein
MRKMQEVPNHETISFWLAVFFWGAAVLCYLLGASIDMIVPLFSLGVLAKIAKYVTNNDRPS